MDIEFNSNNVGFANNRFWITDRNRNGNIRFFALIGVKDTEFRLAQACAQIDQLCRHLGKAPDYLAAYDTSETIALRSPNVVHLHAS